jgi:cysteine desulfurase
LAAGGAAAVVSIMAANNETGAIQPIAEIAAIAQKHGALVHCDAVQAAGHMPLDMQEIGIHMMSLSAHKLGGPMGAGALLLSDGVDVAAMIRGGGQERSRRAGTENAPAIAGFAAAALAARESLGDEVLLETMRDELERKLRERAPDVAVYGANVPRLGNTSCIGMRGVSNETQVMAFDLNGIAVSAGAACSSGKVSSSHVLKAMGVGDEEAHCAIRVSLGWTTRPNDIDQFVDAWCGLYDRTRPKQVLGTSPAVGVLRKIGG